MSFIDICEIHGVDYSKITNIQTMIIFLLLKRPFIFKEKNNIIKIFSFEFFIVFRQ